MEKDLSKLLDINRFKNKKLFFSNQTWKNETLLKLLLYKEHNKACVFFIEQGFKPLQRFNLNILPDYIKDIVLNINNIDLRYNTSCEYTDYMKKQNKQNIEKATISLLYLSLLVHNIKLFKIIINMNPQNVLLPEIHHGIYKHVDHADYVVYRIDDEADEHHLTNNIYKHKVSLDFFKVCLLYDDIETIHLLEEIKGQKYNIQSFSSFLDMSLLKRYDVYPQQCFNYLFNKIVNIKKQQKSIIKFLLFSLSYGDLNVLETIYQEIKANENTNVSNFHCKISKQAFSKKHNVFIALYQWNKLNNNELFLEQMLNISFEGIKGKTGSKKFQKIYYHPDIHKKAVLFFNKIKLNIDLIPERFNLVLSYDWDIDKEKLYSRLSYIYLSINGKDETLNNVQLFFNIMIDKKPLIFIDLVECANLIEKINKNAKKEKALEFSSFLQLSYLNLIQGDNIKKENRSVL